MTDAEYMMELFRGSDLAFGRSEVTSEVNKKGKRESRSWIEKRPVTIKEYERHLEGKEGIGMPPINSENKVRWGAIDVDVYNGDIIALNKRIQDMKLPLVVCRSKSGGPHLYLFLQEFVPAQMMIDKLDSLAGSLGLATSEIFPKQAKIAQDGINADYGSWINLPYYGGANFLRYAYDANGSALTSLRDFFSYVKLRTISVAELEALEPPRTGQDILPDGPPCLNTIMANGPVDLRNITLANLAVYCKKAFGHDWERELDRLNQLFPEPLSSKEVEALKKSYAKKDYRYQCNSQPLCGFCESSICRKRKHGVGYNGMLPGTRSLTKLQTNPVLWFLDLQTDTETVRISLTSEQLQNPMLFQRRAMETINQMPVMMKKDEWRDFVESLMKHVTVIDVPPEMTPEGQLVELLEDFCRRRPSQDSMEDVMRGLPYMDTENFYFRLKDFWTFLNNQRYQGLKQHEMAAFLQGPAIKMRKSFRMIGGRGVNLVTVPATTDFTSISLNAPEYKRAY